MNAEQSIGLQYLRARGSDPWRWAEDASVLVWKDGTTVAFRAEILQVLDALAPGRLPPFGSVVLLLAACRGKRPTPEDILPTLASQAETSAGRVLLALGRSPLPELEAALRELARVSDLPEAQRSTLRAKQTLAEAVFGAVRSDQRPFRARLSEQLFSDLSPTDFTQDKEDGGEELLRHLHIVASGIRGLTPEALALHLRSGLSELPAGAEGLNLPPAVQARQLLEFLLKTPEHRSLALAARQFMAAAQLPRRLHAREELAVGGVAGLSNRGSIDRLLISELAHDDMMLAARVALNEALYLRQEPPEHQPPLTRCLILDSGIRLWGLPRLFACAAALAFAAADLRTSELCVWRASEDRLTPINLLAASGLAEHLAALEIASHPGRALRNLERLLGPRDSAQSVLITHPATLSDPEFRLALGTLSRLPDFICTVDRSGRCALFAAPFHSRAPVSESQLQVESLFTQESDRALARAGQTDQDLPAFLRRQPCPFLLPIAGRADFWFQTSETRCVASLSDRRLVEYDPTQHHSGGRLICPRLPSGRRLWADEVDGFFYLVHAGSARRPNRWVRCARAGGVETIDLCAGEPASAVVRQDKVLLLAREHEVLAYDLESGQLLDRKPSPSRWHRGRYFASMQQFYLMHWEGRRIEFIPVKIPVQLGISNIVALFDRAGFEGPWVLNQLCQALPLDGNQKIQIPLPIVQSAHARSVQVSRDGHRVLISIPTLNWSQLFDLSQGRAMPLGSDEVAADRLEISPNLPSHPLLRSIEAVTIQGGMLCVRTRKGDCFWVQRAIDRGLKLEQTSRPDPLEWWATEDLPVRYPWSYAYSLRVARSPRGGAVVIDSRGLLHLKAPEAGFVEVTLALCPGRLAAWSSEGEICGPSFFQPSGGDASSVDTLSSACEELIAHL